MPEQAAVNGEKVSTIQSLTDRAQDLGNSVNWWNSVYVFLVALAVLVAGGVFIAQFVAIKRAQQLAKVQDDLMIEKDRQSVADSKDKDLKIAEARRAAGDANERAGLANERASVLESANLHLRADLERSIAESRSKQAELEKEQQKTALAQKEAAQAQLSLKEYVSPRRLDRSKFLNSLAGKPKGVVRLLYNPNDIEAYEFASELHLFLGTEPKGADWKGAGWSVSEPIPISPEGGSANAPPAFKYLGIGVRSGLTLFANELPYTRKNAPLDSLVLAISAGIGAGHLETMHELDSSLPDDTILVVVGPKGGLLGPQ